MTYKEILEYIRGILDTNDIKLYDLSAATAKRRGIYTQESKNIPSTRFGERL